MKPRILTVVLAALVVVVVGAWYEANAQSAASKAAPSGAPSASITTVPLNNVARHGFFYAGGKYVGELGPDKEATMGGAMYVEVMVPKQIRSPYPVVFLHGAGQTGVDWLQTPDGRPGWASKPLHAEMAQSGGCEDRLRAPGNCRHQREQPYDDAREKQ